MDKKYEDCTKSNAKVQNFGRVTLQSIQVFQKQQLTPGVKERRVEVCSDLLEALEGNEDVVFFLIWIPGRKHGCISVIWKRRIRPLNGITPLLQGLRRSRASDQPRKCTAESFGFL